MARIVLNPAGVRLSGQNAGRTAVTKVVREVLPGMKRMTPRSPAHLSGSRKPKPGKRVVESFVVRPMTVSAFAVQQRIENRSNVTMTLHEGSKRHRIPNRLGGKVLKFKWGKRYGLPGGGRRRVRPREFSYFRSVMHPGNRKPVHFMTTPLASVARANNFHYRSNFVRGFG
jgi:hypothetical protein